MSKMRNAILATCSFFVLMSTSESALADFTHTLENPWTQGRSSVTYQVQSTFDSTTKAQIQTGMSTWNSVLPSGNFLYKSAAETSQTLPNPDQINTITKYPLGSFMPVATTFGYPNADGKVIESDIRINTTFNFANSPKPGYYDILSVFTHEFGHSLRIGESYTPGDTMYYAGAPNESYMRDLTTADKEAAQVSVARWKSDAFKITEENPEELYDTIIEYGGVTKKIIYGQALMPLLNKNQLVNESDIIVSGLVLSQEVQKDFSGLPVTDTFIEINTVYKGVPLKEIVEVRVEGGETEDTIYILNQEAAPAFAVGEEVTLFLSGNKGGRLDKEDFDYFVVGQSQGKFTSEFKSKSILENNSETYEFTVENLQNEIDQIEKYNEVYKIPRMVLPEGQESNI